MIAGQYNQLFNYKGDLPDVLRTATFFIEPCLIFWIGQQFKWSLIRIVFLPFVRIALWSILVIHGIINSTRMASEDLLYHVNSFYFWWTSIKIALRDFIIENQYIELFLIDIFYIAIGQFLLILLSVYIDRFFERSWFPRLFYRDDLDH